MTWIFPWGANIHTNIHYFWFHLTYNVVKINSVHLQQHIDYQKNTLDSNPEMYHLSHLKFAQLLIDGDIESNPGPVDNPLRWWNTF